MVETSIYHKNIWQYIDRRSIIKGLGSTGFAGTIIGVNTVSADRKTSVKEFEQYINNKNSKHGGIKEIKTAVQRRDGQVRSYNNIEKTQDISPLYSSEFQFSAIEEIQLSDGKILQQKIESKDGEAVKIQVDGDGFVLSVKEISEVLDERLKKAKKRKEQKKASRSSRTEYRSRNVDNYGTDVDYSWEDFANSDTSTTSTPVTGDTYADTNDKCSDTAHRVCADSTQAAAEAAAAGVSWATAEAWTMELMNNDDLTVEFEGEYSASAVNALASSVIELKFFVEDADDDETLEESHALVEDSFLADFWTDEDEYSKGIYVSDVPDFVNIGMEAHVSAAAVGTSTTAISAATQSGGFFDGDFYLDEYTIQDYFG